MYIFTERDVCATRQHCTGTVPIAIDTVRSQAGHPLAVLSVILTDDTSLCHGQVVCAIGIERAPVVVVPCTLLLVNATVQGLVQPVD